MTHEDEKIDQSFSKRRLKFQSRGDYQAFCRIFPDGIPATHKISITHIPPLPEKLAKNPALLPEVEMQCVPLGIRDVAERTDNFQALTVQQLKWLIETYGIVQDAPVAGAPRQDEKTSLVAALRKHLETNITAIKKDEKPTAVIISPEVAAMTEAQLETEAAKLGVHAEYRRLKGKPIATRRMLICKAMVEKEPVQA